MPRWTDTDTRTLQMLAAAATPVSEIAAQMGRGIRAVQVRLSYLRQSGDLDGGRRDWTTTEQRTLWGLFYGGASDEVIAAELGRSAISVIRRRGKLGLRRSRDGLPLMG